MSFLTFQIAGWILALNICGLNNQSIMKIRTVHDIKLFLVILTKYTNKTTQLSNYGALIETNCQPISIIGLQLVFKLWNYLFCLQAVKKANTEKAESLLTNLKSTYFRSLSVMIYLCNGLTFKHYNASEGKGIPTNKHFNIVILGLKSFG